MSAPNSPRFTPPNPPWYKPENDNRTPPPKPQKGARYHSPDSERNVRQHFDQSQQVNLNGLFAHVIHQVPIHPVWHEQALGPAGEEYDEGISYQGRWLFSLGSPASSDGALGSDRSIGSNHSNADLDENIQN